MCVVRRRYARAFYCRINCRGGAADRSRIERTDLWVTLLGAIWVDICIYGEMAMIKTNVQSHSTWENYAQIKQKPHLNAICALCGDICV